MILHNIISTKTRGSANFVGHPRNILRYYRETVSSLRSLVHGANVRANFTVDCTRPPLARLKFAYRGRAARVSIAAWWTTGPRFLKMQKLASPVGREKEGAGEKRVRTRRRENDRAGRSSGCERIPFDAAGASA